MTETKFEMKGDDLHVYGKKVLKVWESQSGWYWFATEKVEEDWNGAPLWYGFVQGFDEEFGDFSEAELNGLGSKVWTVPKANWGWAGRRD
jgi:hypothetical protein